MSKGGYRENSGRKKLPGSRHTYTVLDVTHEYIRSNGDGACIDELVSERLKQKGQQSP